MAEHDIDLSRFDPQTQLWLAEVQLGDQIEAFLKSPVGRYLLGRADQLKETAVVALCAHDAEDPKGIRALQNDIALCDRFQGWLEEAVLNGTNAEAQIKHRDDSVGES